MKKAGVISAFFKNAIPVRAGIQAFIFLSTCIGPLPKAQADDFRLPLPGVMVRLSPEFNPPILKGLKVHPDNPFRLDFILDKGDSNLTPASQHVIPAKAGIQGQQKLKAEAIRLIKYFLASLTIPESDLWVNLSPYEKNRIIPTSFGLTEMGRDLLGEDYMLKQITASLIYPEDETGKKFWKRVYTEAAEKFGTTDIPVNTFNKVWIVPEKAAVYENAKAGTAYVVDAKLKVMLEQDYLSLSKHQGQPRDMSPSRLPSKEALNVKAPQGNRRRPNDNISALGSQILREIVIPELTKEVNEGKNFAQLRQVYNSLILATWYKKKIKDSILTAVYENKNKVSGIMSSPNVSDRDPEQIYHRYLQAFKKGVYNYIKEEIDPATQQPIPRKYFSGGTTFSDEAMSAAWKSVPAMDESQLDKSGLMDIDTDLAMQAVLSDRIEVAELVRELEESFPERINFIGSGEGLWVNFKAKGAVPGIERMRANFAEFIQNAIDEHLQRRVNQKVQVEIINEPAAVIIRIINMGFIDTLLLHQMALQYATTKSILKKDGHLRVCPAGEGNVNPEELEQNYKDDPLYVLEIERLSSKIPGQRRRGVVGFEGVGFKRAKAAIEGEGGHVRIENQDYSNPLRLDLTTIRIELPKSELKNPAMQSSFSRRRLLQGAGAFTALVLGGKVIEAATIQSWLNKKHEVLTSSMRNPESISAFRKMLNGGKFSYDSFESWLRESSRDFFNAQMEYLVFRKKILSKVRSGDSMAINVPPEMTGPAAQKEFLREQKQVRKVLRKISHGRIGPTFYKNVMIYLYGPVLYSNFTGEIHNQVIGLGLDNTLVQLPELFAKTKKLFKEGKITSHQFATLGAIIRALYQGRLSQAHLPAVLDQLNLPLEVRPLVKDFVNAFSLSTRLPSRLLDEMGEYQEKHPSTIVIMTHPDAPKSSYLGTIVDYFSVVPEPDQEPAKGRPRQSSLAQSSVPKNGGIDLNTSRMDLRLENGAQAIRFHIDPAQLSRWQNAPGLVPVIIDIQPVRNLGRFLGIHP